MELLSTLTNIVGGSLFKEVKELAMAYFPPDTPPETKLEFQLKAQEMEAQKQRDIDKAMNDAEKSLNERIAAHEGTASDLKTMPVLGPIMLFLRGAQRPIWGFATLYIDYMVFSEQWALPDGNVTSAFWMMNTLVLGFLFGERAVKNVMPSIVPMMKGKKDA